VARALGGPDPRRLGSGNLGTANLYRVLGRKAGALTLLGDVAKGALPVALARLTLTSLGPWQDTGVALVAAAAVAGHVFPLYLGFKGGKAVATTFGVVAVLAPWAALNLVVVYLLALSQTRTFSVSALICAWLLPVAWGCFPIPRLICCWPAPSRASSWSVTGKTWNVSLRRRTASLTGATLGAPLPGPAMAPNPHLTLKGEVTC